MFKCINNIAPPPLSALFSKNTDVHSYATRNKDNPRIDIANSMIVSRTFLYRGPKLWAEIPIEIRSSISLKSFAYKLKQLYSQKY